MLNSQDTSDITHETAIGKTAHLFFEWSSVPHCPEDEVENRQQDDRAKQRPQQRHHGKAARGERGATKPKAGQQDAHDTHVDIDQQAPSRPHDHAGHPTDDRPHDDHYNQLIILSSPFSVFGNHESCVFV